MAGFFWIEGLDAEELFHALTAEGIAAPELVDGRIPASERGVGVHVLPMGWFWAPFIAQNVLKAVLIGVVPEFTANGAMRHGQPPPEFGVDNPVTHLEHIDDFGAIVLEPADATPCAMPGSTYRRKRWGGFSNFWEPRFSWRGGCSYRKRRSSRSSSEPRISLPRPGGARHSK